jgi:hypothetical protein
MCVCVYIYILSCLCFNSVLLFCDFVGLCYILCVSWSDVSGATGRSCTTDSCLFKDTPIQIEFQPTNAISHLIK